MKFAAALKLVLSLRIVAVVTPSDARAAEPPSAPMLRIEAGMHTGKILQISADSTCRLILTVSEDKTGRLWELPSGKLLRVLRPPVGQGNEGKLNAGALSPDGSIAAIAGFTGYEWDSFYSIYLFDTATGQLVQRLERLPKRIWKLAFSGSGRYLAATVGSAGLRVFDSHSRLEILRDIECNDTINDVDWYRDSRIVTSSSDGVLRLYGFRDQQLVKLTRKELPGEQCSARFSPDGQMIAVGFYDSAMVNIVSGHDLEFRFAPNTDGVEDGNVGSVSWSGDGTVLAAAGTWPMTDDTRIRWWPRNGKGAPQDSVAPWNSVYDMYPMPGTEIAFCSHAPAWGILGNDGRCRAIGQAPIADFRDDKENSHFRVSSDGTTVAFGFEKAGTIPARFSLTDRRLELVDPQFPLSQLSAPPLRGVNVTDWKSTTHPKLDGRELAISRGEMSRSLAVVGNASGFFLGTEWNLHSFTANGTHRWRIPAPGVSWAVNLADKDRLVAAAYGDGTIRWHRSDNGKELLAFFPHADRQRWVLWTPQGYYDCSPGAEELIGWQVNRGKDEAADFFPASKFREQFYRPDVIQLVLAKGDVAAALKAANEATGRKAQPLAAAEAVVAKIAPPVVELTAGGARGEALVPAEAKRFTVRYRVRRGGDEPVTRMRLLIDGRPISSEAPIPANDTEASAEVPLPAGRDCVLSVLAEHRFAVSEPASLRIIRDGAPPPAATPVALKPKLYLLAAGITDYLNNDQLDDLRFAAKDAADFAAALRRQEGGLYQKVEAKVLGDRDATAANILDGLDWIKAQTTAKDVAVIFLSGHGENDEQLRYYFCPHDYDKARRLRTGVSFEEIQKTVQSLAGKVLFFIDSCHAGNALGKLYAVKGGAQVDVTRLVNELADAENGAIVFTSSTGRQLSLELAQEGNGAFTKAIVEGLDGKADLLRTGKITVSSLETFVAERVKELTDGQQTPTVAKPQTVPDFPIALKR